jgi:hypothetical protein
MRTDLLRTLATNFGSNSVASAKAIREMYRLDRGGFPALVVEVLADGPDLPGAQFLVAILASDPDWLRNVCDPEKHTLEQSLDLIERAYRLDPQVMVKLAELLAHPGTSTDAEARFAARVFAVLQRSRSAIALPALRRLARYPNARVRSKAILLIGKIYQNPKFSQHEASEQDPRVAANFIESLWGLTTPDAREAFVAAAIDPHHRVAANGMVGLYLMGDECAVPFLFQLSASEKPLARAAAAWAMGRVEDPRFVPRLARLREDPDPIARQAGFRSLSRVRQKMKEMQAAGTLRVRILACECRGDDHLTRFTVALGEQFAGGLDLRQIVVWNGLDVVEEFSCCLRMEELPYYEVSYQGPSATGEIKVQVYAAMGVGEDTGVSVTS